MPSLHRFQKHFSRRAFWRTVRRHGRRAGLDLIYSALVLYYAVQAPDTPDWARRTIYGALGYLIFPADAIPDMLPGGYVDDLGVIAFALGAVAMQIDDDVKNQARSKLRDWFGDAADRANLVAA